MKKSFSFSFLTILFFTTFAQVTFEKYPVPSGTDNDNYRLVADYYSDKKILLPVLHADTVFAQSAAGGSFSPVESGLYITAFYADNGDLYLVENADTNGFEPHLYKSANNGGSFTEITGVAGRVFHRDQYGNLFYSISGGFAFSTDDGANFTTVATPDTVFSTARNEAGTLYFLADSTKLFRSTDNGANWTDISKAYNGSAFLEHHIWAVNDTIYFLSGSNFYYTLENDTLWKLIMPGAFTSIITNVHVSPDLTFFCTSAYGFFTTNSPATSIWTNLNSTIIGSSQRSIYNNYIAATDSAMYFYTDTGYVYASRIPNTVSIAEPQQDETTVSVFPNPASGQLRVSALRTNEVFFLLNVTGQTVLKERIASHEHTINISALEPGVYLWRMGSSSGKILVD